MHCAVYVECVGLHIGCKCMIPQGASNLKERYRLMPYCKAELLYVEYESISLVVIMKVGIVESVKLSDIKSGDIFVLFDLMLILKVNRLRNF